MEKAPAKEVVGIKKYFFPSKRGVTDMDVKENPSSEEFFNIKENIFQSNAGIADGTSTPKESVNDRNLDEVKNEQPEECISDNYKFLGKFCQLCDYRPKYSDRRPYVLEAHMRSHTGDKPFSCAVCDFSSASKFHLETHMRKHTGEKPFHCPTCPFSAARKQVLTMHLLTHTNEKPFVCTECNFKCARKKGLEQHWSFHCKFEHFRCSVCEYKCRKLKDLKNHVLTHPAVMSCPKCDYMGRCKEDMEKHNFTHMKRARTRVNCSNCGKSLADKRSLQTHILKNRCK